MQKLTRMLNIPNGDIQRSQSREANPCVWCRQSGRLGGQILVLKEMKANVPTFDIMRSASLRVPAEILAGETKHVVITKGLVAAT